MALNEDKYQKIQAYLDQEMSEKEARAFEREISADQELAQELKLHREMEDLLADSPENALRKSLDLLGQEAKGENPKQGFNSRWLWLLLPVLLGLTWWLSRDNAVPDGIERDPPIEQQAPPSRGEEQLPPKQEEEPENQQPTEEAPPPQRQNDQDSKAQEEPPRAIAANFTPNPSLEFLMENNLRDNDIRIELVEQQENVRLTQAGEAISFEVRYAVQSREDPSPIDFKLHLFSNDRQAFEDFSPLSTNDLAVVPIEADRYQIDFAASFTLQPGLYYYLLEDFGAEKIYLVEKFEVR